jgi:peptidoglycan LD-endopeptidase LytH
MGSLAAAGLVYFAPRCQQLAFPKLLTGRTPHETYALALREARLEETALAREWLTAAEQALHSPVQVSLPILEQGYLSPERPRAIAYRVTLPRGRRLVLSTDLTAAPAALVFIDVYAFPEGAGDSLRHVAAADSGARSLEFEPQSTGEYVIRLQPELLRGGRYKLTVRADPTLAFPVQGRANSAIQSGFGARRDGGRRRHQGIDIFAPRGTPVLAVRGGVVTRVQTTPVGGRVVWVRDAETGNNFYYAHLERQLVKRGTMVSAGDTLGLVGNSGNARTTPPHLHFAIYRRGGGPVDPRPWVALGEPRLPPLLADTSVLGKWARMRRATELRAAPARTASSTRVLRAETVGRVVGAQAGWYRVELPDGGAGYVFAGDAAPATRPLRAQVLARPTPIRAGPTRTAAVIDTLPAAGVQIHGRFGNSLFVKADTVYGWIEEGTRAVVPASRMSH